VFSSWFNRSKPLIGIDIAPAQVRVLVLGKDRQGYRVEAFGSSPLEKKTLQEKVVSDHAVVIQAIKQAVANSGSNVKSIAVALTDSAVITKIISLPKSFNDAECEAQIIAEADRHIPYPLEEVCIDFQILGPSSDIAMVDVLVTVSRAEMVNSYEHLITESGLNAKIIDIESYAVQRCCELLVPKDQVAAVIDIGSDRFVLTVISQGNVIFTRPANAPAELDDGVLQSIYRELEFFSSTSQAHDLDVIVLAGTFANHKGLHKAITTELKLPTIIANPFQKMRFAKNVNSERLLSEASNYMVACGLALRRFS